MTFTAIALLALSSGASAFSATPANDLTIVKARIMASAQFQKAADHISSVMGCSTVKKSSNCVEYVRDAAFCLSFADQMDKFKNMTGEKEEEQHCEHIDSKMPELALLLQAGKRPTSPKRSLRLVQVKRTVAPEDDLAKEMTHDLEMNFNKIAPFGKEDTARELQDHAAKTQDTLVDAVENAEVAEIKRAVFRALTRLRAATIKEFDTIARLETQAIDAYNDAHHYRAENPLAHLHEDEAPVETDKLKSFH
jgi:hypothetical protein